MSQQRHLLAAEQAVIGALLTGALDPGDARAAIGAEHFASQAHSLLYGAVMALADGGKPVDLVLVAQALEADDKLSEAGGPAYIAELVDIPASGPNALHHAGIVRQAALKRSTSQAAMEIAQGLQSGTLSLDEAAALAERITDAGVQGHVGDVHGLVNLADAKRDFTEWVELGRRKESSIPTPWDGVNRLMGGLHPGEVTVLAGRPSNGKTAAALNMAWKAARNHEPTAIVSLEMSRNMLLARLAAGDLAMDGRKFRQAHRLTDDEMQQVHAWAGRNLDLPLLIYDHTDARPHQLRALVKRWRKRHGIKLLVVDYLQLVKPQDAKAGREVQVSEISRAFKEIAMGEGIHVLLLSQLNRDVEKRNSKMPMLSDLRESGAIEQDADNVLFICPWNPDTLAGTVKVQFKLAKARNDRTGTANLRFVRDRLLFGDDYMRGDD